MSSFFRLLRCDVSKSLPLLKWRFLVCFIVALTLSVLSVRYAQFYYSISDPAAVVSFTLGDAIVNLFAGRSTYYPSEAEPFVLPATWMTVVLLMLFATLDYPWSDLGSTGSASILACGSRSVWWLAKCAWVVIVILLLCLTVIAACTLAVLATGGSLSFDVSTNVPFYLLFDIYSLKESPWDFVSFAAALPIVLCALGLLQLHIALVLRPLPAFGVMAVLLILSAYFTHPLIVGEYLMAARSAVFLVDGLSPTFGVMLCAVFVPWLLVHGTLWFKHSDLIFRGDS